MLIIISLLLTIAGFDTIWEEHMSEDFFNLALPFKIGSFIIDSAFKWRLFVAMLFLYQMTNVYMEETVGREIERGHMQKKNWTWYQVIEMSLYNLYKWLGTILHILVAVNRLDVWFIIVLVDVLTKIYLWRPNGGRRPRIHY